MGIASVDKWQSTILIWVQNNLQQLECANASEYDFFFKLMKIIRVGEKGWQETTVCFRKQYFSWKLMKIYKGATQINIAQQWWSQSTKPINTHG